MLQYLETAYKLMQTLYRLPHQESVTLPLPTLQALMKEPLCHFEPSVFSEFFELQFQFLKFQRVVFRELLAIQNEACLH